MRLEIETMHTFESSKPTRKDIAMYSLREDEVENDDHTDDKESSDEEAY